MQERFEENILVAVASWGANSWNKNTASLSRPERADFIRTLAANSTKGNTYQMALDIHIKDVMRGSHSANIPKNFKN